jgi:hypothetical protein
VGSIGGRLKRLLKLAEGNVISIPQRDGTVAKFPESALGDAYVNAVRRTCGEDVPEQALSRAARNSPDPAWRDSLVAGPEEVPEPPEDLSE